ncbi:MAG: hypothetical protein WDN10_00060 [bacterium]
MSSLATMPLAFDYEELRRVLQTPSMWACSERILRSHFKPEARGSAGNYYTLRPTRDEYILTPKGDEILLHLESDYALVLECDLVPIACIGFTMDILDTRVLHVIQIQGTKTERAVACVPQATARFRANLNRLKWDDALVDVLLEVARRLAVESVRIRPAEMNPEYKRGMCPDDLRNRQLVTRYDRTAMRLGFMLDPRDGWYARTP